MIRKATLFDLPELYHLATYLTDHEIAIETAQDRPPRFAPGTADKEGWALQFALYLTNPEALCLIAFDPIGTPIGYMLSSIGNRPLGQPARFLQVHQLYVDEPHRKQSGGKLSAELQALTREWASEKQVYQVEIAAVPANVERWTNQGFVPFATLLRKDL